MATEPNSELARRGTLAKLQGNPELKAFLKHKKLETQIHVLKNNKATDLEAILKLNASDMTALENALGMQSHRDSFRALVAALKQVGLEAYRTDAGLEQFKRVLGISGGPASPTSPEKKEQPKFTPVAPSTPNPATATAKTFPASTTATAPAPATATPSSNPTSATPAAVKTETKVVPTLGPPSVVISQDKNTVPPSPRGPAPSTTPSTILGPGHLESFVSIRMGTQSELSGHYCDKFIVLKDGDLKMMVSFKDQVVDRVWPLDNVLANVTKLDAQTLRLQIFNPSTLQIGGLMDICWPSPQITREWMKEISGFVHTKDELVAAGQSAAAATNMSAVNGTGAPNSLGGQGSSHPPQNTANHTATPATTKPHTEEKHDKPAVAQTAPVVKPAEAKPAVQPAPEPKKETVKEAPKPAAATTTTTAPVATNTTSTVDHKHDAPKEPKQSVAVQPTSIASTLATDGSELVNDEESKTDDDADRQGRLNVEMMMQGCNFILYEFQQKPGEEMLGNIPPQTAAQIAADKSTPVSGVSWNGARHGSIFNPLQPSQSRPRAVKQSIFIFYSQDETLFGSIYWGEQGTKVADERRRLRFHLLSDIYVGKQTPVFATKEGQAALEEKCFSLISHEEGKALDLEAESEEQMEQWLAGLKFILVSSGKGVVVNKQDEELPTPEQNSDKGNESGSEVHEKPHDQPERTEPKTPRALPPKKDHSAHSDQKNKPATSTDQHSDKPSDKSDKSKQGDSKSANDSKSSEPTPERMAVLKKMLIAGAQFKKIKHGRAVNRLIWCSTFLDHICWGDGDKKTVRGFLLTKDLKKIARTIEGKVYKIVLQGPERTLELEAKSALMMDEWAEAFEHALTTVTKARKEAEATDKVSEKFYMQTLRTGDTFKKWPSGKQFKKGAHQVRKLITDHGMQTLFWGDAVTNYVKGSLAMSDIVEIQEVPTDDMKFTIITKGRLLDLEAKSAQVRTNWINALRWWLATKK